MILITVMYPAGPKFDMGYYLNTTCRWCASAGRAWACTRPPSSPARARRTAGRLPFQVMALLKFESADAFATAAAAHGAEIFADIPNFTDAQAQVQLNEFA